MILYSWHKPAIHTGTRCLKCNTIWNWMYDMTFITGANVWTVLVISIERKHINRKFQQKWSIYSLMLVQCQRVMIMLENQHLHGTSELCGFMHSSFVNFILKYSPFSYVHINQIVETDLYASNNPQLCCLLSRCSYNRNESHKPNHQPM